MNPPPDSSEKPISRRLFPRWFYALNMLLLIGAAAILLSYVVISVVVGPPYDYQWLMAGSELFCYDNSAFSFGWPWLYPGPFYSTFCGLTFHQPNLLLSIWIIAPFLMLIALSGFRAAALAFPPFFVLLLLGQSSWLLLPLFTVASRVEDDRPVPWWYALTLPAATFKPHIAFIAVIWLAYRWRRQTGVLLVGAISILIVLLPSSMLRPDWLFEWLPRGRGYEAKSLASIAIVPVNLLGLGADRELGLNPGPTNVAIIWIFSIIIAAITFWLLRWRRGRLEMYDWMLIFCLANPLMNDYDLVILLPFIANRPQRLLLALTAGIAAWVYAMLTGTADATGGYYNGSLVITVALIAARLLRLDSAFDRIGPLIRW